MDTELTRRNLIRIVVAGGAAWPLVNLFPAGTAGKAGAAGAAGRLTITREDERAFAQKLLAFQAELTDTDLALLHLTMDIRNYVPDPRSDPPQSRPVVFAGQPKNPCTCSLEYVDGAWELLYNASCSAHANSGAADPGVP